VVVDRHLNLTPLGKFVMPPPLFERQIVLDSYPAHVDMHGHILAALCLDGTLVVVDVLNLEAKKQLKFPLDIDVTKMTIFELNKKQMIAISTSENEVLFFEIQGNELVRQTQAILDSPIYSWCVGASISTSGYPKIKTFYSDNSYYTDV